MRPFVKYPLLVVSFFAACMLSFVHRSAAQSGLINTVAGGGTSMGEGVPSLSTSIYSMTGIGIDAAGNIYYMDMNQFVLKKIDVATGLVHTIAGINGSPGYSGDGGAATSAKLSATVFDIAVSQVGDVYIADAPGIRKVNASSGIITTILTTSISARLFVDSAENIYTNGSGGITRIDAITGAATILAGGSLGNDLCMDNQGNIYTNNANIVQKRNATTGVVTVVAGVVSSSGTPPGTYGDGIPATSALFDNITSIGVDGAGNLFIADRGRGLIRRVNAATGIVNTIAGTTPGGSTIEGTPALSATINPYMLLVHPSSGEIFYSDKVDRLRKFSYLPMVPLSGWGSGPGAYMSDSFRVNLHTQCSGLQMSVHTATYHAGMTLRTYFGDGEADTSVIGASWTGMDGFLLLSHVFPASATYSVKHILCNSGAPVDSITYHYDHRFCSDLSLRFYYDLDGDCEKGSSEPFLMHNIVTEVDSNGVPVDTIMATAD